MKYKLLFLLFITLLSPLIAGLYGSLHDQITYAISPEYFSKFKFYQFGLDGLTQTSARLKAAIVGFMATWWFGLPLGILLGLVGLVHQSAKVMGKHVSVAFLLALAVTAVTPVIALPFYVAAPYFSGIDYAFYQPVLPAFVPAELQILDGFSFYIVGIIHSYSYVGGLLGTVAGIVYLLYRYRQNKRAINILSIS